MDGDAKKFQVDQFHQGWLIGAFSPSLVRTKEFEIGIKRFSLGQSEPCHFQKIASEITIVIEGRILLAGQECGPGEGVLIPPGVHGTFESLSPSLVIAVKIPSAPQDKIKCELDH